MAPRGDWDGGDVLVVKTTTETAGNAKASILSFWFCIDEIPSQVLESRPQGDWIICHSVFVISDISM